jgi:uncharacterized membrane protein YdjX (TVP38/TMEM64 family)
VRKKLSQNSKKILNYSLLILLIFLVIFYLSASIEQEEVVKLVERSGLWAPAVYIILLVLTFIFAPLSGTPFFLAGFSLFGRKLHGYTYLANLLATAINFWIARMWGRDLVEKLAGKENLKKIDEFTQNYGIKSLIILRIVQTHFHDFISYAYGLTNMKFIPYFIISALGALPWFLTWQFFLYDKANNVGEFTIIFLLSLAPFWAFTIFFFSKMKKGKK